MSYPKSEVQVDRSGIIFRELPLASCMSYPVGSRIQENIKYIEAMITTFKSIVEYKGRSINLICMGSSGAIIATMFALHLPNSKIHHIKKDGESSHSSGFYLTNGGVNVIVDDIIESGSTMNRMYEKVKRDDKKHEIDVICISGTSCYETLDFAPKYLICGRK